MHKVKTYYIGIESEAFADPLIITFDAYWDLHDWERLKDYWAEYGDDESFKRAIILKNFYLEQKTGYTEKIPEYYYAEHYFNPFKLDDPITFLLNKADSNLPDNILIACKQKAVEDKESFLDLKEESTNEI